LIKTLDKGVFLMPFFRNYYSRKTLDKPFLRLKINIFFLQFNYYLTRHKGLTLCRAYAIMQSSLKQKSKKNDTANREVKFQRYHKKGTHPC